MRLCVCPIEMYSMLFFCISVLLEFLLLFPFRHAVAFIFVTLCFCLFSPISSNRLLFFRHSFRSCRFVVAINANRPSLWFFSSHSSFSLADDQVSKTKDMDPLFIYRIKHMRSYQIFFSINDTHNQWNMQESCAAKQVGMILNERKKNVVKTITTTERETLRVQMTFIISFK